MLSGIPTIYVRRSGTARSLSLGLQILGIFEWLAITLFLIWPMFLHRVKYTRTDAREDPPGELISQRFEFEAWWLFAVSILFLGVASSTYYMAKFFVRQTFSILRITFVFFFVVWFAVAVGFYLDRFRTCNDNGEPNNPCNDPLYCCVYWADPANDCPNAGPCAAGFPTTKDDLSSDFNFRVEFGFFVVLFLLSCIDFGISIGFHLNLDTRKDILSGQSSRGTTVVRKTKTTSSSSTPLIESEPETGIPLPPASTIIKTMLKGLSPSSQGKKKI